MNPTPPPAAGASAPANPLWVFTPSRTAPQDLEAIFVQRQKLLEDAVDRVRESAQSGHKHHLLFVGPRGSGKTHLITLLVSRLLADAAVAERLRLAWLNEDETCTTVLDLFLKIHAALAKRYPAEHYAEQLAKIYEMEADAAQQAMGGLLLAALGERTLVVVIENLDALFEGLGSEGQMQLRAFLQENPKFALVATAQRLVEDLSDRANPFYGFFQTEHLKPLSLAEATELLQNIARLHGKTDLVEFLATSRGRSRVRALHHLSGGNHRIYIVLSQFITRDSLETLLGPFLKMVDELTPYYQERLRWLPILQRKIVELLCVAPGTVSVKEIAKKLFATSQTVSSALQDLRGKGYVESSQRGRESLYEVSEPLMRICVEVKDNQDHQPLRLLVDFLRVWYDHDDLKQWLGAGRCTADSRPYLEAALLRNEAEGNLRVQWLVESLEFDVPVGLSLVGAQHLSSQPPEGLLLALQCLKEGNFAESVRCLTDLVDLPDESIWVAIKLSMRGGLWELLGNRTAAIADYTRVIELPSAPTAQVAKCLVNRGVVRSQQGDGVAAIIDFTRVIEMPGAPTEQMTKALFNRGFIYGQRREVVAAIADYTRVIDLPGGSQEQVAKALVNRGLEHGRQGDVAMAIADYTRVIELFGASIDQVAKALINRGAAYGLRGDFAAAIADNTRVVDLAGEATDLVAMAVFNRGIAQGQQGNGPAAIMDFTQVIELPGAPTEQVVKALINRGVVYLRQGEGAAAIADYTRVIELSDAPIDQVAMALVNRGLLHCKQGEVAAAIIEFTRVIELHGAPAGQVARALINRGVALGQKGEVAAEIADYARVIELANVSSELVAEAFINWGIARDHQGEVAAAIADYTRAIELPGAPVGQVARALVNRGVAHSQQGQATAAIADYTRVTELPGAPVEQVTMALVNRGAAYFHLGNTREAQTDFESTVRLPQSQGGMVVRGYFGLAELHGSEGRWPEALAALEAGLRLDASEQSPVILSWVPLIEVLFSAGLSHEGREAKVADLLRFYRASGFLPVLGEALIKHLGTIFRKGEPLPASDNLEQWAVAWETAAAVVPDFVLSLRLLRVGIDFLKAGGKDRGILLTLASSEREILRQALELTEEG